MLADPDTYWHVATGNWILEHGAVPHTDPFSYSMPGASWTAHEWLSEVILAGLHSVAGWTGLVALTCLCFATTLALLTRYLLRHLEPAHALMLVALTGGMLSSHLLARPHMLVAPLLALWLKGLVMARERNSTPSYLLVPLMSVWANLHGSFTLGIGLVGAFGLEAAIAAGRSGWKRAAVEWSRFLALVLLAAMLTPFHWKGLLFTGQVMSMEKALAVIGEWRSPNFQVFNVFEVWLLVLLAIALAGRIKLPLIRLLMILGFVHLSLRHGRYMAVTGIVAPFLIAQALASHWYASPKLGKDVATLDRLFIGLVAPARRIPVALAAMVSVIVVAATLVANRFEPNKSITPAAGLAALTSASIEGPIFNSYGFGGYLIYSGVKVFIDGRADMYGDRFVERYVDATNLKSSKDLTDLLDEYRIGATMLTPDTPAVALLDHLPNWRRLHGDEISVVHVRVPGKASNG